MFLGVLWEVLGVIWTTAIYTRIEENTFCALSPWQMPVFSLGSWDAEFAFECRDSSDSSITGKRQLSFLMESVRELVLKLRKE